ncbi:MULTISPECIES: response regulator transcription factor [Sphingomonadaceae]|jgi:two-component system OmpR family response regulator|uniref:winged helix-turn-helix domain-containing protein n=1 Tax=Sphingomonadaceae TaxID=41297 RepID=UPI0008318288|nr:MULTISPECIES: response regulator transcription factor [Sphingomonadaceae]|tara:strand:+ start:23408 stop:24088 length:681 start_codon:yes stop_codon:yes gene_type:complete
MKLLLLEDDDATRSHIEKALTAAGHVVDICLTGLDAVFLASSNEYSVIILDRMVPELDGLSALKQLRAQGVSTPAILLTGMDGIRDRVEGLEGGADDYLVKPFATTELVARVAALARRPPSVDAITMLRVGDLELDLLKRTVSRAGRRIELQAQEMKLLEYLLRHKGEVVTRTMMLENVWSFHFDPQTNLIESHMSRLRAKIDRGFGADLIHTVRGSGYRIEASPP